MIVNTIILNLLSWGIKFNYYKQQNSRLCWWHVNHDSVLITLLHQGAPHACPCHRKQGVAPRGA